ncbi:MarR family winged helix-turn-helix transcriptional regulator [Agreia sp.]|uniref:MarR family winged helix-turn-helix transcriptional regulator n=1 Tax=Agreia sp. TaxID=1872416 RepID=UPI0035BBE5ED
MTTATNAAAPQQSVLDDLVCFALYDATHAITQIYRSALAPWGLTYPQYLVFVVLWNEGPLPLGDLGRRLELDSGTLSPLTKRMEQAGFIERRRASDDARVVTIALTAQGERMREELEAVPACVAGAMKLDLGTATRLRQMLHQLADDTRASDPTALAAKQATGASDAGQ